LLQAEFSEWNSIFLYVINTLQTYSKRFQQIASVVQQHEQYIESFVGTLPGGDQLLEKVKKLPVIWETQSLVVEGDTPIRNLLRRLLRKQGTVQVAVNGEEGLAQIGKHVFNVIVSDVELPDMAGATFYRRAVSRDSELRARFVFCLGQGDDEQYEFLHRNEIRYVKKPFNLQHVVQAVDAVLEHAAKDDGPLVSAKEGM
jgi:CheY-like chemotaxis protein